MDLKSPRLWDPEWLDGATIRFLDTEPAKPYFHKWYVFTIRPISWDEVEDFISHFNAADREWGIININGISWSNLLKQFDRHYYFFPDGSTLSVGMSNPKEAAKIKLAWAA